MPRRPQNTALAVPELNEEEVQIQEWIAGLDIRNPRARELAELAANPTVPTLGGAIAGLEAGIRRQAAIDVLEAVASGTMTQTQIKAVYYGAMLNRSRVINFAGFEIMYSLLRTIRDERLAQQHPNDYTTVNGNEDRSFLRMAEEEAGVSNSVASDLMILGDIILPYVEEELGVARAEIWERISTTNLRAMTPILRLLINRVRETDDTRRPQDRITRRMQNVEERWAADELNVEVDPDNTRLQDMTQAERQTYLGTINANRTRVVDWLEQQPTETVVRGTVGWLLDAGENTTTAGFTRLIGTAEDNAVEPVVYEDQDGVVTMVSTMTRDQYDNMKRVMRTRMSPREVRNWAELLRTLEGRDA
ncbi:hypothetical protein [Aggregatilinea lenta]|uniref:hypothetical protein n=1 Tax=Aggregatilinea lenta TaxID=913108 RepID=UPI000E5BC05A|nr:hypothetical protein [Aggregatilinea lenta]